MRSYSKTALIAFILILLNINTTRCQSFQRVDTLIRFDTCECSPSLPLEIVGTSVVWGLPSYYLWRSLFDRHLDNQSDFRIAIMPESLFLLMFSLGPIAEWTSGCEASYWHTLWIGLSTEFASVLLYGIYGFEHPQNIDKFNVYEYIALGIVPSVASSIIFNQFLHPKLKSQSVLVFPSLGAQNTASLNVVVKF